MSITSDAFLFETRPATITGMVRQLRKNRGMNPKHRLFSQDDVATEKLSLARVHRPAPARGSGKHRDTPIQASLFIDKARGQGKHRNLPFVAPKSLYELINGEA